MTTTPVAYEEHVGARIPLHARSLESRRDLVLRNLNRALLPFAPVAAVMLASGVTSEKLVASAVIAVLWSVALRGAYGYPRLSPLGTTMFTAVGTLEGLAAVSLVSFWFPGVDVSIHELLAMAALVFVLAAVYEARSHPQGLRRLLLVGADERMSELLDELAQAPRHGFDVIGLVDDDPERTLEGVTWLGTTDDLESIVREQWPNLIVLGHEGRRADALSHVLDVASLNIRVVDVHHFNEHAFGKVPVHHLSPVWFMGVVHLYQRPYSRLVKRVFDVLTASSALVLLAPVLLAVSVLVRVSSPGPVFFRQRRLGEGGKLFAICKFRTMREDAEAVGGAVWAQEDDPRVTGVGRVLRRTRVDELPQLWNVLRGEMSIVGPRPERPEFLELLQDTVPFWTRRHLVKPGITGWAQVRRGYTADAMGTAEKLAYDLYYLKYRSFLFDLAIAARTVRVVLSGFGSR